MTEELLKEDKPRTIKLGEKEYELSPLNLNIMTYIEEDLGCSIEAIGKLLETEGTKKATVLRQLIFALLKDNYPELTISEMGKLISLTNFEEVTNKIREALMG